MNHFRYLAYRRVNELLDAAETEHAGGDERALIRDMAEQMLLTRAGEAEDADEVAHSAAMALRALSARGSVTRTTAIELWEELCAAGPEPFVRPTPVFPAPVSEALRDH